MDGGTRRFGAALVVFLCLSGARCLAEDEEDWSKSPEAYFLTSEERREWGDLRSRESRQAFIEKYWLQRDPSPGTDRNEFRELVGARIKTADARYRIERTAGSRTAQGFVFIVFGTPARVQKDRAPAPAAPRRLVVGDRATPYGFNQGTETLQTWLYDRERTPRILEAIGAPSLTVNIVVEPNRHRDELQNPGLVNEYRERLARKSIVNPDLVPSGAALGHVAIAPAPASATLPLSREVRVLLEKASPQGAPENEKRPIFGSAILWGDRSAPETLTWVYFPGEDGGAAKMNFHALVRPQEGGP
jgi:GWxTD domain-containing protein